MLGEKAIAYVLDIIDNGGIEGVVERGHGASLDELHLLIKEIVLRIKDRETILRK